MSESESSIATILDKTATGTAFSAGITPAATARKRFCWDPRRLGTKKEICLGPIIRVLNQSTGTQEAATARLASITVPNDQSL